MIFFSISIDSIPKDNKQDDSVSTFSVEGRADVHIAKKHLVSANRDFMDIGAFARAKDVLYLMVNIYG